MNLPAVKAERKRKMEILRIIRRMLLPMAISRMLFLLFKKLYRPRYDNECLYGGVFLGFSCITAIVNALEYPFLNVVFTTLAINLINFRLYIGDVKRKLIYMNLIVFVIFFCDNMAVSTWMLIQNHSFSYVIHDEISKIIASLIEIILLFLAYHILVNTLCRAGILKIRIKQMFFLIMIMLFEIISLGMYAVKSDNRDDGIVMAGILTCFLLFNIAFMGLLKEISELYQYKYELALAKRQNEIQLMHYQEMEQKYQNAGKVIHDIRKHLSAIMELQNKDKKRAKKYCQLIGQQVEELFNGFQCSNKILSIVMSQKISMAEKNNIRVETRMQDISLDFISDMDMTAIFANLWDNAMEACRKVEEEKERFILLEMKKLKRFVFINMENSYCGTIQRDKKQILSTKENHQGMGIAIIEAAVQKYGGEVSLSHTEERFRVKITIPMEE